MIAYVVTVCLMILILLAMNNIYTESFSNYKCKSVERVSSEIIIIKEVNCYIVLQSYFYSFM